MVEQQRVCVVTGAGRGLGQAIALHLAGAGAGAGSALALCARTATELEGTAEQARALGALVHAERVDVADPPAVRAFAEHARAALGPATGLVNNAAVLGPVGRIDTVDLDEWRAALLTNVAGTAATTAAFVPQMAERGGGSVVNLSGGGIGGPQVEGFMSAYTSSKAAVAVLTETLARELADAGIRVNAVAPGPLATGFVRPVLAAGPDRAGAALFAAAQRTDAEVPAPGIDGLAPGVAALLDFLLSDDAAAVTGRLLSARWESVEQLRAHADRLHEGSLFTLRRIDDALFGPLDDR